jgi:hypothetical protein
MGFTYGSLRSSYRLPSYGDTTVLTVVREPSCFFGMFASMRLDLKYAEFIEEVVPRIDEDAYADSTSSGSVNIMFGMLAKYPFVFDQVPVKVTPLLGFGLIACDDIMGGGFMFGGRIDVGLSEIAYLRSEYLQAVGGGVNGSGGGAISLKAGGGLDIPWGKKKKAFWRTELMYNYLSAYYKEYREYIGTYNGQSVYEQRVDGKSAAHYMSITTGIGYKWGGVKKVPVEIREIGAR